MITLLAYSHLLEAQWVASRGFTARDGLAQSQITAIEQDAHGYLWIATQGGVSRFNGARFLTLTAGQGLPDDVVSALVIDPLTNAVWLGTDSGALARWDGQRMTPIESSPAVLSSRVTALHLGAGSRKLLIGTKDGLWTFENDRFTRHMLQPVADILVGSDGEPWILTGSDAESTLTYRSSVRLPCLVRFSDGSLSPTIDLELGHRAVTASTSAADAVWLALDDGGLVRYADGALKHLVGPEDEEVLTLWPRADGGVWIGTNLGLWALDAEGQLQRRRFDPAMSGIPVSALYVDHEENLWIGTWTQGIYRQTADSFTLFTTASGLPAPTVWALAEDAQGCIWIGTDYGGLARWCSDGWRQRLTTEHGLPSDRVLSLHVARDGSLWIGTDAGVARLDHDGSIRSWNESDGLPHAFVRAMAEDPSGRVWVGTSAGLARFDGAWRSWTSRQCLPADPIRGLVFDPDGDLWIATDSNGVLVFDGSTFEPFTTVDGLPNNRVWTITIDSSDRIWAGTDSGIWVHARDGSGSFVIGADAGLPRINVLFLVEDGDQNTWAGTTSGIARIDASGRVVATFSTQDGAADGEANENAALRDRDGLLWFGMSRGVTRLDPSKLVFNKTPPPISIERALVNGELVAGSWPISPASAGRAASGSAEPLPSMLSPAGSNSSGRPGPSAVQPVELVLGPSAHELRIEYAALSFMAPEKVRYRVLLEGYDPGYGAPTEETHVTYRNVPPGRYAFSITACNNHGIWAEPYRALVLRLRPHWYQTIWFKALVAATAALLGLAWLRSRFEAEHRLQRRLEEEVTTRTAELQQANARIREQNHLLAELSLTDPLTGLGNRRVLAEQLPTELAVLRRELIRSRPSDLALHHGAALVMLDLDNFKVVNDRWGHDTGDRLLKAVAQGLTNILREVDVAVRWGGEELVVLARGVDRDGAEHLALRILRMVETTHVAGPHHELIGVTASAGFIRYPLASDDHLPSQRWHELVDAADRLLYLAKERGRARACGLLWPPGTQGSTSENETLDSILENPLEPSCGIQLVELTTKDPRFELEA